MDNDLRAAVGKTIRRFRRESGLTIEELAFRAQLHPNYLGDIERGCRNPSLLNLQKIACGLKRPPADLFPASRDEKAAPAAEKHGAYFSSPEDRAALPLLKSLRGNSEKDRQYILRIARSLSVRFTRKI